jgi:hypothetical protein
LTLFPDENAVKGSLTDSVRVYIAADLTPYSMAEIFSHEFYGHANLYLSTKDVTASSHKFLGLSDANVPLTNSIIESKQETVTNLTQPCYYFK